MRKYRVIQKLYPDEVKCGGCNWKVRTLYALVDENVEVIGDRFFEEYGLCANCFAEMLAEEGYEIVVNDEKD